MAFRQDCSREDDDEFEIHALDSNLRTVEDCQRLAELGVTDICVTPWNPYMSALTLDDKLRGIDKFANTVFTGPLNWEERK
jgi:hypothetical protein